MIYLPTKKGKEMKVSSHTKTKCVECGRVFDLLDEEQANEFFYGHDCEEGGE